MSNRRRQKMRHMMKMTAILTVVAFVFAMIPPAQATSKYVPVEEKSTTEKVVTAVAVGAIAGLAIYALSKSDKRHHRHYRSHRPYRHRGFVAFDLGFSSYSVGSPYVRARHNPHGYWVRHSGMQFYRVPYVYNHRHDRAYNAGWERGYWAGYIQGLNDSRYRYGYNDRFDWHRQRYTWGYSHHYGPHRSYERAFHRAYRSGYRHGFRGHRFGHDGFGFGLRVRIR